jgi:hypothetical protein
MCADLKPGEYSMVASPRRMQVTPPLLKVCLSSRGSKEGSSSAPTPSSSTGLPNWMAFSSTRSMSPPLEGLITCSGYSSHVMVRRTAVNHKPQAVAP